MSGEGRGGAVRRTAGGGTPGAARVSCLCQVRGEEGGAVRGTPGAARVSCLCQVRGQEGGPDRGAPGAARVSCLCQVRGEEEQTEGLQEEGLQELPEYPVYAR